MSLLQEPSPVHPPGSGGKARVDRDDGDLEPLVILYGPDDFNNTEPELSMTSQLFIVIWLAVLVFIVQFSSSLFEFPLVSLLQDFICHKFYSATLDVVIAEEKCMVDDVQDLLKLITKGLLICSNLPGILTAVYWGVTADRCGRMKVLIFSILGMMSCQLVWSYIAWDWQEIDMRYVSVSYLFLFVGGGQSVAQAMVFTMISDVAPEGKRAVCFQVQFCAIILAQALGPIAAAAMIKQWDNKGIPILLAPEIMATSLAILCGLPETSKLRKGTRRAQRRTRPVLNFSPRVQRYVARNLKPQTTKWSRFLANVFSAFSLRRNKKIALILPGAAFVFPSMTVMMGLTLQYIQFRFGWPLALANAVVGILTGFNILVLLMILPIVASLIFLHRDTYVRDFIMAHGSAALLVVGQTIFFAAGNFSTALIGLSTLTLGTGFPSLCRAVLTRLVARDSLGMLFGLVAFCEQLGYLVYGLGYGWVFHGPLDVGLDSEGNLLENGVEILRLKFVLGALTYALCGLLLWWADLKGDDSDVEDLRSDGPDGQSLYVLRDLPTSSDGGVTTKHASLENPAMAF